MQPQPRKPTVKAPADWFTGDVWIDPIVQPEGESRLNVGAVHFTLHHPRPRYVGGHVTDADYDARRD